MSYYATVFSEYWTGPTGRAIQQQGGKDATLLGLYLFTNRHVNMIGLYRLEPAAIIHETPLNFGAIVKALHVLTVVDFADYDAASEHVWVREMARFRLGLTVDKPHLHPDDKRADGAQRLYAALDDNPFLEVFYRRYVKTLHLKRLRTSARYPKMSPLTRGLQAPPKPVNRDQVQRSEIRYRDQGSGTGPGKSTDAAASASTHPVENSETPPPKPVAHAATTGTADVPTTLRRSDGTDPREPHDRQLRVEGADQASADRAELHVPGVDGRDRSRDASSGADARETVGTTSGDDAPASAGTPETDAGRSAVARTAGREWGARLAPRPGDEPPQLHHLRRVVAKCRGES